ncbi:MAG: hypothetical protein GF308_15355 [Candidatus Heimdallarchaeota archaeon]|nr:hypothetical protein [Candidatus Heimdallarchaeota archaeon]
MKSKVIFGIVLGLIICSQLPVQFSFNTGKPKNSFSFESSLSPFNKEKPGLRGQDRPLKKNQLGETENTSQRIKAINPSYIGLPENY